jgi:hypothetical protein
VNDIYFGADYAILYTRVWVQTETEEENRSMENKRDSEIDGCYTVGALLFPSLPPSLHLSGYQPTNITSSQC